MPSEIPHFDGWPKTIVKADKREITIIARYQTPLLQEWTRKIKLLGSYILIGYFIYFYRFFLIQTPFESSYPYLEALSYLGVWLFIAIFILPFVVRTKLIIIFNSHYVKIKTPLGRWKKFKRNPEPRFSIGQGNGQDRFTFSINGREGIYQLPGIYGVNIVEILHHRIEVVKMIMNDTSIWGHMAVDRMDFEDLDRSVWPMSAREKQFYYIGELFWLILGYLAGTMALVSLFRVSFFLLHRYVPGWVFIVPPGEFGQTDYLWWWFLGGSLLVLLFILGNAFHHLIHLIRFTNRSGRVKDYHQVWELEEGGFIRLNLGVVHWTLCIIVAMTVIYGSVVYALDAIVDKRLFGYKVFKGWRGYTVSGGLGGLAGLSIFYLASFLKSILDFPWKGRFQNRDTGIRDFVFYFYDVDPEKEENIKNSWFRRNYKVATALSVFFGVIILWMLVVIKIDPLFDRPLHDLYFNTDWFKWIQLIIVCFISLVIYKITLKAVKGKLEIADPLPDQDTFHDK